MELPPREINVRDPRSTLQAIFRRWLPLPDAILRMVVRCMPNPRIAQSSRINTFITPNIVTGAPESLIARSAKAFNDVEYCRNDDSSDVMVFISKMAPIRVSDLSARDLKMLNEKRASKIRAESPNSDVIGIVSIFIFVVTSLF